MKQFLNNDIARCNNVHCPKKEGCKRFAQYQLDIAQKIYPRFTVNFPSENCEKIIKFK